MGNNAALEVTELGKANLHCWGARKETKMKNMTGADSVVISLSTHTSLSIRKGCGRIFGK